MNPISLVTDDHVRKVLLQDRGTEARLQSWKTQSLSGKGDNFATVVTCVQVEYSINGKQLGASYIAKLTPARGSAEYLQCTHLLFTRETKFYTDVIPDLNLQLEATGEQPLRCPRCFLTDLTFQKELLYLEDLRPRGFKIADSKTGLDMAHITLVVEELARMHSASLLFDANNPEPIEVKHDFLKTYTIEYITPVLELLLNITIQILQKIGGYVEAEKWIARLRLQIADIFTDIMKTSKFSVLCQGDCWSPNVLFRYNSEGIPLELMMLDPQIPVKSSVAQDLNYFIFSSVPLGIRRNSLRSILSSYYAYFKRTMEAGQLDVPFSEEELFGEFRAHNKYGCLFNTFQITLSMLGTDGLPDVSSPDSKEEELLRELGSKAIDTFNTNQKLRSIFLDTFEYFRESGYFS